MVTSEIAKRHAIQQFIQRKKYAVQKIDNSKLKAGEPMYFYCRHCDNLLETLPEDYLFPRYKNAANVAG